MIILLPLSSSLDTRSSLRTRGLGVRPIGRELAVSDDKQLEAGVQKP